jgi:uncharacterized protein YcfJ
MKILLAAVLATAASLASANEIVEHDYARVVSVTSLTRTGYHIVPRTSCTIDASLTERCTTHHDREYYNIVTGYSVTIEYQGQLRTVRLSRQPSDRVPVKVVKRIFVIE